MLATHSNLNIFVVVVVVVMTTFCSAIPSKKLNNESSNLGVTDEETRATWLETRNLENNFKELVYLSLQELVAENRLNPEVLAESSRIEKRGRHQGFCFKKTKSGRFLPYICWKGEGENDDK
uniref:Neuron-specific protein n=1 Tax=Hirudo medicinalis TaxID=6421 RepID=P91737_HIRME|nr:neuron-specific protein [Hirudo medicinalis]